MPRLFTGIEIPAGIAHALDMLRGGLPGARWIDRENYHITLRFIGDVDDVVAQEAAYVLGQIRRRAFDLHLEGLASFGGRKPRAVVASVPPQPALLDLQAEQERLLRRIGLEPEPRKFTARGYFRTAPFMVSRFVLFSSRASTGGGPYVAEALYPLNG